MDLEQALAAAKEAQDKATALEEQLNKLKENNSSLIEEKRKETEAKQALAEEAKKAAQELAKKNGDYEQVIKTAEEERNKALQDLQNLQNEVATEKVKSVAKDLAHSIAFDDDAAKLLAIHFASRLQYSKEGIKITKDGALTALTTDDLVKEFQSEPMFKALIKGTQATGGRPTQPTGRPGNPNPNPDQKISAAERLHLAHEARK